MNSVSKFVCSPPAIIHSATGTIQYAASTLLSWLTRLPRRCWYYDGFYQNLRYLHNWKRIMQYNGKDFRNLKNAQCNSEIAQIDKLRGTYTLYIHSHLRMWSHISPSKSLMIANFWTVWKCSRLCFLISGGEVASISWKISSGTVLKCKRNESQIFESRVQTCSTVKHVQAFVLVQWVAIISSTTNTSTNNYMYAHVIDCTYHPLIQMC